MTGTGTGKATYQIQPGANKIKLYLSRFESLLYPKKTNRPKPNQNRKSLKQRFVVMLKTTRPRAEIRTRKPCLVLP